MERNYDYKHEFTEEDIKSIIARYINEQYGQFNEPRVYTDDVHLTMERNEKRSLGYESHYKYAQGGS